ncbi:TonB-dependent receptor [Parahaliea aestuarii]|uniref:TonB-dependent receptor n=1 Tax=Parahaliea aestuarii TaxID=1852021 RepID=A0A5C9A4N0_9GAMM|nr:TonB-dependent receptor [Parahaliea aestuarii]TXS94680.1 TonB-dependent receptor [Parahaliea aestuarii]
MTLASKRTPLALALLASPLLALSPEQGVAEQILEEVIVTAQKRSESIQDVPIAVSAFTAQSLEAMQVRTSIDLQNYVPNLSYTGSGEFSIRGVGGAVIGTTGDVGVGMHQDNVPLIISRAAQGEIYDLARVEVLRGPQGTLFGRNATGGVVNFITQKPLLGEFDGYVKGELASYDSKKMQGAVNIPLGDLFAARLAGSWVERDGYSKNIATGNDVDGRDQWSSRVGITFSPGERFTSTLSWEHFEEDSTRNGGARSMCIADPGPDMIGSTAITNEAASLYLSRGCDVGSIYQDSAYGNANSVATFGGRYAFLLGLVPGDVFANQPQSTDPREASYFIDPEYVVENDVVTWDSSLDLNEGLQLNLLLGWSEDTEYTRNGGDESGVGFFDTPLTPGGVYTDFQSGPATGIRTLSIDDRWTEQRSVELRLQSDYDGPLNFNLGAFYFDVERENVTFVSTNSTSLFAQASGLPLYFDENPDPAQSGYDGHQYLAVKVPYELESQALFGELYWQAANDIKITLGLRYTDDTKRSDDVPALLFQPLGADGIGTAGHPPSGPGSITRREVSFDEWTGRLVLDWTPDLSFTEQTLVYASYSRGYKAGGFNPPDEPNNPDSFEPYLPEYVNAYEIGTKNMFAGGRALLNVTAYYYDYKNYQIAFLEEFSARNTNVNAESMGLEIESQYAFDNGFSADMILAWQDTEISDGQTYDPFDRTQGREDLTYIVSPQNGCVVPTASLEPLVALINAGVLPAAILANASPGDGNDICEGGYTGPGNPLAALGIDIPASPGVIADIEGNELPNSPKFSYSIGLSYTTDILGWNTVFRADYSWKDESYATHFNGPNYEIESWDNANLSVTASNDQNGLTVQAFVRNLMDSDDTVIDYGVNGQGVGQNRVATLLDPRLYGLSVTWGF